MRCARSAPGFPAGTGAIWGAPARRRSCGRAGPPAVGRLGRGPAPRAGAERRAGLSLSLLDLREAGGTVETRRIPLMFNYHTYQVFFSGLRVPADQLIGAEG